MKESGTERRIEVLRTLGKQKKTPKMDLVI